MQTTSVKLYSLEYSEAKTYLAAALFLAGNIVLPQLCHLVQLGGPTMLPIYFFTLVGAYKYGWRAGLLVGAHDIAKAVLAVLLCRLLFPAVPLAGALSGAACVAGHMFPFYMRFHGGKGCWPAPQAMPPHASAVRHSHCWQPSYSSTRRPAHWANGPSRVRSTPPCRTSASACRACCCKSSAAGHSSIS